MQQCAALEVRLLAKAFDRPVVSDLDLNIEPGCFYALLGANGAGKTTTLRMIAGLLKPDRGSVRIFGIDAQSDPVAAKRITAWVPDEPLIYDKLTPWEYLEFVAGLWSCAPETSKQHAETLMGLLELKDVAGQYCETLSKGMRQKVALAGALVHQPRLIILDEPLTGLDAASSRRVKAVLREQVDFGASVLMTTHILEVAERMAERIGVIHDGRLIEEGNLAELRQSVGAGQEALEDVFLSIVQRESAEP